MTDRAAGFPIDDYTPHGFLATPHSYATSWSAGHGGNLSSSRRYVGFGWLYPWARGANAGVEIVLGFEHAGVRLVTRADFDAAGLRSPYHSANLFRFAWETAQLSCTADFVACGEDAIGVEVAVRRAAAGAPTTVAEGEDPSPILYVVLRGWRRAGRCSAAHEERGASVWLGEEVGRHTLTLDDDSSFARLNLADGLAELLGGAPEHSEVQVALAVTLAPPNEQPAGTVYGGDERRRFMLRRGRAGGQPRSPATIVGEALAAAVARDDDFWAGAARLDGDWPDAWRRGWVYDLETTRMCIMAPAGIFADVWPSWMIQWPRAVLAEGSLDCLRLSYGDPELATRAVLSLLRDAPAPNVPCVFSGGQPNMVAKDGSVCGTSPAWCVPFYNIELLYLRTGDRAWLAAICPLLAGYLDWWLEHRTDDQGWAVYKCTWEAGEDDTPRLDPEHRGDSVVSEFVRPVELQATMALSARVLARFARVLDRREDAVRWNTVALRFEAHTQALWDERHGRYRDWDRRVAAFLDPSGESNYWGIDPCRYSALAFTPLLAGAPDEQQVSALARELELYNNPPWTLWASWSYVILESALCAGQRELASRYASSIVGRVYRELDERLRHPTGPTPGVAREYWPLDLAAWDACEGYGWGATTSLFLMRQIFGLLESEAPEAIAFRLWPGLPPDLLQPGRRYWVRNVPIRGEHVDVEYAVGAVAPGEWATPLAVEVRTRVPFICAISRPREGSLGAVQSATASTNHGFTIANGEEVVVTLINP